MKVYCTSAEFVRSVNGVLSAVGLGKNRFPCTTEHGGRRRCERSLYVFLRIEIPKEYSGLLLIHPEVRSPKGGPPLVTGEQETYRIDGTQDVTLESSMELKVSLEPGKYKLNGVVIWVNGGATLEVPIEVLDELHVERAEHHSM